MANALAIAAVTAVIRDLLADGLIDADLDGVGGIVVTSSPLELIVNQTPRRNQLNVLLTHASPNAGWSTERLPTHDGAGAMVRRPLLALNLHYLITALGADDFAAEALLGYAMHLLHERPTLGPEAIRRSLGQGAVDGSAMPPLYQSIAAAELADQVESIRITPQNLDLEGWAHIWSSQNVGLRPSAVYEATVALIEGRAAPRDALPVLDARLSVSQIRRPRIVRTLVDPGGGAQPSVTAPLFPGSRLLLRGSGLTAAQETRVSIDGRLIEPEPGATDAALAVQLPIDLVAGVATLQVLHFVVGSGGPADLRPREQSNAVAIGVRPVIDADAPNDPAIALADVVVTGGRIAGEVTVRLAHPVEAGQRASLRLNGRGAVLGRDHSFIAGPLETDSDSVAFAIANVAEGPYLVRIEIDGAESVLETDASGFSGPIIEVEP